MKPLTIILASVLMLFLLVGCEETDSGSRSTTGRAAASTAGSEYSQPSSVDSTEVGTIPRADAQQINSEVSRIMAGEHGELPEAHHAHADNEAHVAEIEITNQTSYTLTVLFAGPTSRRATVPSQREQRLALATGAYNIAAEVNAPNVEPFAGSDSFEGGVYDYTFIIQTEVR